MSQNDKIQMIKKQWQEYENALDADDYMSLDEHLNMAERVSELLAVIESLKYDLHTCKRRAERIEEWDSIESMDATDIINIVNNAIGEDF